MLRFVRSAAYGSTITNSMRCSGSLRIYLAAAFARRAEIRRVADELDREGHTIVSSWIRETHELGGCGSVRPDIAGDAAVRDLGQLRTADLCVVFATPHGREDSGRGGRHVEFGAALAWEIPVIVVGPHEHLFHALASAVYPSWKVCRDQLRDRAPDRLAS